jgi:hypothetical protein
MEKSSRWGNDIICLLALLFTFIVRKAGIATLVRTLMNSIVIMTSINTLDQGQGSKVDVGRPPALTDIEYPLLQPLG